VGALISIVLVLSGSFETLIAIASVLYVAVYMSGFVALLVLRIRQPELRRPFKMWGYPWTSWGVLLASAVFLIASVISDLKHSLFTLGLIAISYPVYFFAVKRRTSRPGALPDRTGV
jgi:APA family basic amino acid/polyamine antiporter